MSPSTLGVLTVWGHVCDSEPAPPGSILWAQYASGTDIHSLPEIVGGSPGAWISEYAAWMREVGNSYIDLPEVQAFTRTHRGLQYWWMSLPAQQSLSSGALAYDVVRMMALADFVLATNPDLIRVDGLPWEAQECLRSWCQATGRRFEVAAVTQPCDCAGGSRSFGRIGTLLKGLKQLIASISWPSQTRSPRLPSQVMLVDYVLDGWLRASALGPSYESPYWGPLPELLTSRGLPVTWIHIYAGRSRKAQGDIRRMLRRLGSMNGEQHLIIQDLTSPSLTLRAWSTYRHLRQIGRGVRDAVVFTDPTRSLDLGTLAEPHWVEDHEGASAASNALWIHWWLTLGDLPPSRVVYPMENQPWEMAMLQAVSQEGSTTAGFVHTIAWPWDLRYAAPRFGPVGADRHPVPAPHDVLVGNDRDAVTMKDDGYAPSQIWKVEGLRFLQTPSPARADRADARIALLVLGEYQPEVNDQLLAMVEGLGSDSLVRLLYRPHPVHRDSTAFPSYVHLDSQLSLLESLREVDIVLTSGITSAALLAHEAGIPVACAMDPRCLPGGQIASVPNVPLGHELTVGDVRRILNTSAQKAPNFYRDTALARWSSWLDHVPTNESGS